ncbi:hypothetical protein P154DRAFT_526084 [Amniculicola lignicola CBS 123094]|uniref:Uncharacterized protein n=1 Tax=Amniculicola lignicola CBS 123094 TaxID=1392246 RepID=A0A6A5W430_9PLEO|nr:hypothetical protein P154DRAFT_526084 [Amniculicola lignicola CBS 123094]
MAPLRRYLRITKHSVLEVRIYLDRPSDAEAWLLRRDNPALPRVIQAVRPLVLPKLREENERVKGKGSSKAKKKGVKDVVVEDDFEVSIFLTELSSRHSVLTKQKIFKDKPRIQSNSSKLTHWLTTGTSDQPVVIAENSTEPIVLLEEDEDDAINLDDISEIGDGNNNKRKSRMLEDKNQLSDSDDSFEVTSAPPSKRGRPGRTSESPQVDDDDENNKKKLGLNTSYDGFSIYGRILCLVVKRKGARNVPGGSTGAVSSQQMLENWVSTQAAAETTTADDDG